MDPEASPPPLPRPGRTRRYRKWLAWAAALLLALAAGLALLRTTSAERRALEGMDPAERRLIYQSAFAELQRLCGAGPRADALESRCTEQVAYVLQFPECDEACQRIARSHTPRPTK